jgi:hypothetical protein
MSNELKYFNLDSIDQISWGHAVNTLEKLVDAVEHRKVMMIEVDTY